MPRVDIYVMTNGIINVACTDGDGDGLNAYTKRCANVRHHNTGGGLGKLAADGPINCILDDENGTVINMFYCIRKIPCDYDAWKVWANQYRG